LGTERVDERGDGVEQQLNLAAGHDLAVGSALVALLALDGRDEHGHVGLKNVAVRLERLLAHDDLHATGRILELEEADLAAGLGRTLAEVLDHAADRDLRPVRQVRDARGRGVAEAFELLAVTVERVARQVEAERALLALEQLLAFPRLGLREGAAVAEAGTRRGRRVGGEHAEQVGLAALAVGASRLAAL